MSCRNENLFIHAHLMGELQETKDHEIGGKMYPLKWEVTGMFRVNSVLVNTSSHCKITKQKKQVSKRLMDPLEPQCGRSVPDLTLEHTFRRDTAHCNEEHCKQGWEAEVAMNVPYYLPTEGGPGFKTNGDSNQHHQTANDSVNPHIVHPKLPFEVSVRGNLDDRKDSPCKPKHKAMEEEEVKGHNF